MADNQSVNSIHLYGGDCLEVFPNLEDNSFDSVVTDPPYALAFMNKTWDSWQPKKFQTWCSLWAAQALRVLKPGGHLLAFGGTRTYHRLVSGIEDAGFEIRDSIMWHYGQGWPKSLQIGKAIDKALGAKREVIGKRTDGRYASPITDHRGGHYLADTGTKPGTLEGGLITKPATAEAERWERWGTALKPATELIVMARKPLSEKNVVENVLKWGTGAINIRDCLVPVTAADARDIERQITRGIRTEDDGYGLNRKSAETGVVVVKPEGRWPANVATDGSDEVVSLFPESAGQQGDINGDEPSQPLGGEVYGHALGRQAFKRRVELDRSAARFFFCSKATKDERVGSDHPTVKPIALMRWLVRMVTRQGGLLLDPFAGTGTTGEAAYRENVEAILIEREPEYREVIVRRLNLLNAGPAERTNVIAKAKSERKQSGKQELPLFSTMAA